MYNIINTGNQLDNGSLDRLLEGFQLIGYDWKYLYINETAAKQSRFSKEELIGSTMMEKFPQIQQTELFVRLQRCMQTKVADKMINHFYYEDNEEVWLELRMEPVPEGILIHSIDISEQKRAEKKLLLLNESLEKQVALRTAELETKNKEIIDSINYAKRIQDAKLPDISEIYSSLDCFILFKPKAIVSGDFYFFHENKDTIIVASADCTGHGVPGAFMSMICLEKLNELVLKYDDVSDILKQLNNGIKHSLKQSNQNNSPHISRDGMDIALCSVDKKNNNIKYAGANRPLWIVRQGSQVVEEIHPTKKAIGGFTDMFQDFIQHEITLQKGDSFYLFSDGYADQFGGQKGKKLKTQKFKELLISIQDKSMEEQEVFLNRFIEKWKKNTEQIDDILVFGVRL